MYMLQSREMIKNSKKLVETPICALIGCFKIPKTTLLFSSSRSPFLSPHSLVSTMNCGPYRETKLNDSFHEEVQRVVDLISSVSGMNWLKSDDAEDVHA
jgi:hypothetical protein